MGVGLVRFPFLFLLMFVVNSPVFAQDLGAAPMIGGIQAAATDQFIIVTIDDQVRDGCWTNAAEVRQTIIDRFNRFGLDAAATAPARPLDYWGMATFEFAGLGQRVSNGGCVVSWSASLSVIIFQRDTGYSIVDAVDVYSTMGYTLGPGTGNADLNQAADNVAAEVAIAMQEFRRTEEYATAHRLIEDWRAANPD